jgi:hypothetical protein
MFRYTKPDNDKGTGGKVTETSIGDYPKFEYKDARQAAQILDVDVRNGIDPVEHERAKRKANRIKQKTVGEVWQEWIEKQSPGWSEGLKYDANLYLNKHCAALANIPIGALHADKIEEVLSPLRARAPEQARRTLRLWLYPVLEYADWQRVSKRT